MKVESFFYHIEKGWSDLEKARVLDSEKSLIVTFFSPLFADRQDIFDELKSRFPKTQIVGCSTSGEIAQDHVRDRSLTCVIMKFNKGHYKLEHIQIDGAEKSYKHGQELARKFPQQDLKGLLVLADGLNSNGSDLVRGINSQFDSEQVVISGGLAGDGSDFSKTHLYHSDKISSKNVLGIGFYGKDLTVTHGTRGGWDIFGPKREITKSDGNILYEIDGGPALKLYKEYLGEKAKDLPASGLFFPLELSFADNDKKLVRTILGVDEETQSLMFAGNIPQGANAQLMRANFNRVIEGANDACLQANQTSDIPEADSLIFAVSCVGRRLVLGSRSDDEIEAIDESSPGSTVVGFYSYGELSPIEKGSPCELHNQTMTIMKVFERKAT